METKLVPETSENYARGFVAPKLTSCFGATKPPGQPEDGDEVSARNVGKPSHLDATVYPTFRVPTPFPSSGYARGFVAPKLTSCFGATKPPGQPEDGDEFSARNDGKPSHLDAAVYPRKFH